MPEFITHPVTAKREITLPDGQVIAAGDCIGTIQLPEGMSLEDGVAVAEAPLPDGMSLEDWFAGIPDGSIEAGEPTDTD